MNEKRPVRRKRLITLPVWLVGAGFLLLLVGSGYWLFKTAQRIAAEVPIVEQPDFDTAGGPVAEPEFTGSNPISVSSSGAVDEPQSPEGAPISQTVIEQDQWEGTERVTILLMGIDRRCGESGPVRTDSLMLLTVDPVGKTAGILSLPRDLWVEIPGFGVERINQAHFYGEGFEYPGGGPALAVDTVETTLGININYYAAVNFEAFTQMVDTLDGITIDVPQTIDDPDYPDECYGFDPFYLEAGTHTLNGENALKYARTRTTQGGDIDRAGRQQQVILAARDQAISQIPELITRAPPYLDQSHRQCRHHAFDRRGDSAGSSPAGYPPRKYSPSCH
ncbi:MAG: LCP family protein [Chloroflexota bacterium]